MKMPKEVTKKQTTHWSETSAIPSWLVLKERIPQEDFRHKDNFFNYGYMGNFLLLLRLSSVSWIMVTELSQEGNWVTSVLPEMVVPNTTINPVLAQYGNLSNGIMRSDRSSVWNNLCQCRPGLQRTAKGESDFVHLQFPAPASTLYRQFWKGKTYRAVWCYYEQSVDRVLRPYMNCGEMPLW